MPIAPNRVVPSSVVAAPPSAAEVREATRLLRALGYRGKDGERAPSVASALRTFQRACGLPRTGAPDPKTLERLRLAAGKLATRQEEYVTTGVRRPSVKTLESQLKKLGYDVGKVDEVYSRSTFEAVKAFKADRKLESQSGSLGIPAQKALARAAQRLEAGGGTGVKTEHRGSADANVRAISFNWPPRYKAGGERADEALFDQLSAKADVMGLSEFRWGKRKIADGEKGWAFYNPNPPRDGDRERPAQVLAWNTRTFELVKKGTSLLHRKTRVQEQGAGPTIHPSKSVIWARLRHRETGEVWTVAVAHFVASKHLGGAAEKLWRTERDALAKWMKAQGPRTIVMGDFNGQWNERIARPLRKVAKNQSAPSHGRREIDWVLRSRDLKAVGDGKALGNGGQSDHRPVKGVVRG